MIKHRNTEFYIYFRYLVKRTSVIQKELHFCDWSTYFELEYDWIELKQQLTKSVQNSK